MSPSITDLLADIHGELAKALLAKIKSGTAVPGDFMAAIRFLKDNGYDSIPKQGSPVADLAKIVPFPKGDGSDFDYPH